MAGKKKVAGVGFVKVIKNKPYFKRFQVKYRRRREGKTDYRCRKRLICQDKNKYNSPKYRLVVRISNTKIICQIAYAEIDGDKILASAISSELPRYGLSVGLKNYSAAYCTGLLVGRRLLKKLGLDSDYQGNLEVDGEIVKTEMNGRKYFVDELAEESRPFRANLDCGLITTTTGNRVFGALKGATDAGLDIPHTEKRFPGYDREEKSYSADVHRERIFGLHVTEHMSTMKDEDKDMYMEHFSQYIKHGVEPDDLEDLYTSVHAAIRKDPASKAKVITTVWDKSNKKKGKKSNAQRKGRVAQIKAYMAFKAE